MAVVINGTTGVSGVDGSAGTPSYQGTDSNTGIFFPAADTIAFGEGGAEAMRIDSSGNVGIGTSSPSYKLHVSGSGTVTGAIASTSANSVLRLTSSGGYDQIIEYTTVSTAGLAIKDATAGANRMYITSAGDIGIGTSTPSTAANGGLTLGTTSAGKSLILNSSSSGNNGLIRFIDSAGSASLEFVGGTSQVSLYGYGSRDMLLWTNGTERARITSGGNFLIGNTDGTGLLTVGSSKLAIGGQGNAITSGTTGQWTASNSSGGTCAIAADYISSAGTAVFSLDSATTNGYYFRTYDSGYDYRFRIAKSGSATNSTGSYGTISDARTKTVVGSASSQWDDIKQLNFIKYKLNKQVQLEQSEENKDGYVAPVMLGLVAQEVEQICPGLIEESADPEFDQVKVIKTSILYMKAVKALQEAMTRIEALEAEVAALKGAN